MRIGDGQKGFYSYVKQRVDDLNDQLDLIGPDSLGRGETGSRQDWDVEMCWNLWVYIDTILDYLFQCFQAAIVGILRSSVYVRLTGVYFTAEAFGRACMWDFVFNPTRALTNAAEANLDGILLAPLLDDVDDLAVMLQQRAERCGARG